MVRMANIFHELFLYLKCIKVYVLKLMMIVPNKYLKQKKNL